MPPLVTIVTPVLDDAEAAGKLLSQLPATPEVEIILVDGGDAADLERLVHTRHDTRLYRTQPGRGRQMNAGAAAAGGEWLLFLHADSQLPAGGSRRFTAWSTTSQGAGSASRWTIPPGRRESSNAASRGACGN